MVLGADARGVVQPRPRRSRSPQARSRSVAADHSVDERAHLIRDRLAQDGLVTGSHVEPELQQDQLRPCTHRHGLRPRQQGQPSAGGVVSAWLAANSPAIRHLDDAQVALPRAQALHRVVERRLAQAVNRRRYDHAKARLGRHSGPLWRPAALVVQCRRSGSLAASARHERRRIR